MLSVCVGLGLRTLEVSQNYSYLSEDILVMFLFLFLFLFKSNSFDCGLRVLHSQETETCVG